MFICHNEQSNRIRKRTFLGEFSAQISRLNQSYRVLPSLALASLFYPFGHWADYRIYGPFFYLSDFSWNISLSESPFLPPYLQLFLHFLQLLFVTLTCFIFFISFRVVWRYLICFFACFLTRCQLQESRQLVCLVHSCNSQVLSIASVMEYSCWVKISCVNI